MSFSKLRFVHLEYRPRIADDQQIRSGAYMYIYIYIRFAYAPIVSTNRRSFIIIVSLLPDKDSTRAQLGF